MTQTVTVDREGDIAVVTLDNPPVNATSHAVRQGLMAALDQTDADPTIRAVILICAGHTFVAGADVREFGLPPKTPLLPEVVMAVEASRKPWVAAIQGTGLGGGLELALACAFRIAAPDASLGLPEVILGLIPGAGGTVRLPRLVGPSAALEIITSGRPVSAQKALDIGLIDALAKGDLRVAALRFVQNLPPSAMPLICQTLTEPENWHAQCKAILSKTPALNAPKAAVQALQNAIDLPPEQALAAERTLFNTLKDDPQSAALRHIFFAERKARSLPETKGVVPQPLHQIGVIGGGTMGAGIAAACLLAGLPVTLTDRNETALNTAQSRISDTLAGSLKRALITDIQYREMAAALTLSTGYDALADADLIIEAVFEDMAVKKQVFAQLDAVTRPDAVLASNTSYLDLNALAATTKHPSRVLGLHFFSPAHIMKLLELVIPQNTAPEVLATAVLLGQKLGKIIVPAGVCDGFIGNRIMSAYRRECDAMVQDGATPWQVDAAMRNFGFPMGLYEMQDLAGLDIAWAMRKRQSAIRDPAQRYVDIADRLCQAGRLGRKTGSGWYDYASGKPVPDPITDAAIEASAKAAGIARAPVSDAEIMPRILRAMQSEGRAILTEGIARRADDIDVVMVNGYAFPRWLGGPMFMAKGPSAP